MSTSPVLDSVQMNSYSVFARNGYPKLDFEAFDHILSFVEPKDLGRSERVCKIWNQFILANQGNQWKRQCQTQLGLSIETDPTNYLPAGSSYKERLRLLFSHILIFDQRIYEHHIGTVGPVPPIPKQIALKRWNDPDPCDPSKTIGEAYVWMWLPSYIKIPCRGFCLDGIDDPENPQAPKLISCKEMLVEEQFENATLNVPLTINNIAKLFYLSKTGNRSDYFYIWPALVTQHGNERLPKGWICMRREVIGRNLTFVAQQALANANGVVLSELLPRILFNFIEHVRSQTVGFYPDGINPWTIARTSTLTRDEAGTAWPSDCGLGDAFGLSLNGMLDFSHDNNTGVAVMLPGKV